MTKTVIEMAREAGFSCLLPDEAMDMMGGVFEGDCNITKALERFAALVAEATKERCAVAAEQIVPRHTECGNKIAAAIRSMK